MRIGVVGLGLIGASFGGALRVAGYEVAGYDSDPKVAVEAHDRGLIDRQEMLRSMSQTVDVMILAAPTTAIVDLIPEVGLMMRPEAVLMDVASVKRAPVNSMDKLDPAGPKAVGGHPLCGKETSGVGQADCELFRNAAFAVVATSRSDSSSLATVSELVRDVGATPIRVDADTHDTVVARTSHLPQVLSSALSLTVERNDDLGLHGTGLESMLRLAGSDEHLWTEILLANRDNVKDALDHLLATLEHVRHNLETADRLGLETFIRRGREAAG